MPAATRTQNLATRPLKLAIVGAGGFAGSMTKLTLAEGARTQPAIRVCAVAEPDQQTHAARLAELRQGGVATFASFDDLLARADVEAVWLPLPIALHRPFTERAVAAGKAVLCEKPVAGCIQDVDAMISACQAATRPVAVGYQHTYEPTTKRLQQRLRAGDIGAIQSVTLQACWPRAESYYRRNLWAGRFQQNGVWVMDSPANNAMAHHLHLALFLLDAVPVSVEAELYRVYPIENFDTVSLRVTLTGGIPLLVVLTHACCETVDPQLVIQGASGHVEWSIREAVIQTTHARESLPHKGLPTVQMLERFARLVHGIPDDTRLVATLEASRPHTVVVNAASEATTIVDVPRSMVDRIERDGEVYHVIRGIEEAFAASVANRQMLHESRRLAFTQPAGVRDVKGYSCFRGPKR